MNFNIASSRAAWTDGICTIQVPDAALEAKFALGKSPNRADVDHIAAVGVLQFPSLKQRDFRMLATIYDSQLVAFAHFLAEADAAGAENTTLVVQYHMGADRKRFAPLDLVLQELALVEAEFHIEVLKITLSGLVANRTIQRVVGEQELKNALARQLYLVRFSVYCHALRHLRIAGDLQLWHFFDFDKAHAAASRDAQAGVITVTRDVNPKRFSSLNDRLPLPYGYLLSVDRYCRHRKKIPSRRSQVSGPMSKGDC